MRYRTARRLIMLLGLTALVLALSLLVFIENAQWVNIAMRLIMVLIVAAAVLQILFCRCPHCGGYIKRFYSHCPHCGEPLGEVKNEIPYRPEADPWYVAHGSVLALSLLVIQSYTWILAAVPLIVVLIGACYVVKFVFCKCPNCGGYLRHYYPYCPHCGSAIDEND